MTRMVNASHFLDPSFRYHGRKGQGDAKARKGRTALQCSGLVNGRSGKAMLQLSCGRRVSGQITLIQMRHCMASAVAGFMRTFGIDEPMGCYDDRHADAFVLWGFQYGREASILWTRLTDRKLHQIRTSKLCCAFQRLSIALTSWPIFR